MLSVDLTETFDLVDMGLLNEHLKQIEWLDDIVGLVRLWLSNSSFPVNVNEISSILVDLPSGVIQGSIHGSILYAIYVSPFYNFINITNLAVDNFILKWNKQTCQLIT
jgi:hypothetical protein